MNKVKRALESAFQYQLKEELRVLFPGCYILKLDSSEFQGIPDLLVLFENKWAILEVKRATPTRATDFRPNQEWYIAEFNAMSYSSAIFPENKEVVLSELQQAFGTKRQTRYAKRE